MSVDLGEYGAPGRRREAEPEARTPRRPWTRRRALVTALAVLLVLDGLALAGRRSVDRAAAADPRTAALAFFTAFRADDAAAARAQLSAALAGSPTLTSAALATQIVAQYPEVTAVRRHGDEASVSVRYAIAEAYSTSVLTEHRDRTGLLHAPRWRITAGLPVVRVQAPAYETSVRIAGVSLPLAAGRAEAVVFPGTLAVALPQRLPAGATAQTVAADGTERAVVLEPGADGTVRDAVENEVGDRVLPGLLDDPTAGTSHFVSVQVDDIDLSADGRSLTFRGEVVDTGLDGGKLVATRTTVLTGTADYASGAVALTTLVRSAPS